MIIAKIRVNGTIARTVYRKAIPAGIIGAQVEFDYADDIWHGLRKTVVFKGAVTKDVVTDANIVTIPHEVVEKPSFRLRIGVYGVDSDGNVAIPTLWEDIGAILDAADPSGDTNTDPSLPVWAQIQEQIGNLDELTTEAKSNLVAAINEAKKSGGGESVQPDWNQNDSTAADYVKNRPFYTGDLVETVLVEETTVPFEERRPGLYSAEFLSTFEATVGETYKVSWDGTAYECICVTVGDIPYPFIGNASIIGVGTDTGEPFLMAVEYGHGGFIYTADTSASHTFSIGKTVVPVVKIDKKYLAQPDWNQNDENAADFVKNRPFYANSLVSVRNPSISEAFWYKVSDAVPTGEHSVGAPCSIVVEGERTNSEIFQSTDDYYVATEALVFVALKDNVEVEGITFPKKGTYFAYFSGTPVVTGFALGADADSEITWDGRTEKELKKLDEKFLPDNLATKSDVEVAQTAASAAQTAASAAQTAARNAQSTANAAKTIAENAKIEPVSYNYCASLFSKNGEFIGWYQTMPTLEYDETSGSFNSSVFETTPLKYKDIPFTDFICNGYFKLGGSSRHYILFLTKVMNAGSPATWFVTGFAINAQGDTFYVKSTRVDTSTGEGLFLELLPKNYMIMHSSTPGSSKKFKITVDDSGALTATEVV